jgi:hypothetical protein
MATYDRDLIKEISEYNAQQLAGRADSYSDNEQAELFYTSIRDAVIERVDYIDADDWEREMVEDYSGQAHEIADNGPDAYTWIRWQEFVGTQAWQEDVEELSGGDNSDLTAIAGIALYIIATRLVAALSQEIFDAMEDGENEE